MRCGGQIFIFDKRGTKDFPDRAVVVGVPGKVISYVGSIDYVDRTDYEDKIT